MQRQLIPATLLLLIAGEARADDVQSGAGDKEYNLSVGPGAAIFPTYQGSNKSRVIPLPVIEGRYGRFFVDTSEGIGVDLYRDDIFRLGASVTYVAGYDSGDVPKGINGIDDTAGARVFGSVRLDRFTFSVGAVQSIGGAKGLVADAGLSYYLPLTPSFALVPSVSTTWADGKYMDNYFGISAAESVASGLPSFKAKSGFKDASLSLTGIYRVSDRWTVTGNVGATMLFGDALDTPLNQEKWNPTGFLGLSYRF
ncbi:MipA/OmpV family protein [Paracoccus nototheniae]|uniref:MipA/OmpV family protein n=1 Tax=Paracoccus nototheniae TaxID=2489002 RepID=A0ABW4DQY6_9RHOB|nr:MipA/OmpV family protein [Paracoccus nototheniae]